jgi:catalase
LEVIRVSAQVSLYPSLETRDEEQPTNHPFIAAHAKGELLAGTFTPSADAAKLSKAPHFQAANTPVWVRFSNSTGIPNIPDNAPDANPRGLAIRFHLPEVDGRRKHTDIIAHSVPLFPVRTGAEFLEFLQAAGASGPDAPHPTPVEQFVGSHQAALAFVTYPKPAPASYATQQYYGVSAFKLVDTAGHETFIRYHVVPENGVETLEAAAVAANGENYLQDELPTRLKRGPIVFKITAQIAEDGDVTDDATVQWPESRKVVELGTVKIESIVPEGAKEQKNVIFDPVPRVEGVEPSADPLLEMRAAIYLLSGNERRAA